MVSVVISLFFCHNCTKEVDKAGLKKGRGGGGRGTFTGDGYRICLFTANGYSFQARLT